MPTATFQAVKQTGTNGMFCQSPWATGSPCSCTQTCVAFGAEGTLFFCLRSLWLLQRAWPLPEKPFLLCFLGGCNFFQRCLIFSDFFPPLFSCLSCLSEARPCYHHVPQEVFQALGAVRDPRCPPAACRAVGGALGRKCSR